MHETIPFVYNFPFFCIILTMVGGVVMPFAPQWLAGAENQHGDYRHCRRHECGAAVHPAGKRGREYDLYDGSLPSSVRQ